MHPPAGVWSVASEFAGPRTRLRLRCVCCAAEEGEALAHRDLDLGRNGGASLFAPGAYADATAAGADPTRVASVLVGRTLSRAGVVVCAARHGHVDVLDMLAAPPFSVTPDLLGHRCFEFGSACTPVTYAYAALREAALHGHASVVDRLARAPYALGRLDAVTPTSCRCACDFGPCKRPGHAFLMAVLHGHTGVLDRLATEPYSLGRADAHAVLVDVGETFARRSSYDPYDLIAHKPRPVAGEGPPAPGVAAGLRRLAQPPFRVMEDDTDGEWRDWCRTLLLCAADSGDAALVDVLGAPPFSLGGPDARRANAIPTPHNALIRLPSLPLTALEHAARCGHVAVLDRLALPPFSLGHTDAVAREAPFLCSGWLGPLTLAAVNGHAPVLDRLSRPPYCLGRADARAERVVVYAVRSGHAEVLDRLVAPPYIVDRADVPKNVLCAAVRWGLVDVLDRLAEAPFSLGHAEARAAAIALKAWQGSAAVSSETTDWTAVASAVRRLTRPPYSVCMRTLAEEQRHTPVVRVLVQLRNSVARRLWGTAGEDEGDE